MIYKFPSFRNGVPESRIIPLGLDRILPPEKESLFKQLNLNSTTEIYNFIRSHPKHLDAVGKLLNLREADLARFNEDITQAMENHQMIDSRCGPQTDPCRSVKKQSNIPEYDRKLNSNRRVHVCGEDDKSNC